MTHEAALKAAATRRARLGQVLPVVEHPVNPAPAPVPAIERLRLAGVDWFVLSRQTPYDFERAGAVEKAAAMRANGQLAHVWLRRPSSLDRYFAIERATSDGSTGRIYSSPIKVKG